MTSLKVNKRAYQIDLMLRPQLYLKTKSLCNGFIQQRKKKASAFTKDWKKVNPKCQQLLQVVQFLHFRTTDLFYNECELLL